MRGGHVALCVVLSILTACPVAWGGGAATVRRFDTVNLEVCRKGANTLPHIPSEGDLKVASYNIAGKLAGGELDGLELSELSELMRSVHVLTLIEVSSCSQVNRLINAALIATGATVTGCKEDCFSAYIAANDVAIVTQVRPRLGHKANTGIETAFRFTNGYFVQKLAQMKIQLFEYKTMKPGRLRRYESEPVATRSLQKGLVGAFFKTEKAVLACDEEFPEISPRTLQTGTPLERQAVIILSTERGKMLAIIGVHLKAGRPTSKQDVCTRSLQALHVSQMIRYLGFPSIVMGDMNDSLKPFGPYPTPRTNALKKLQVGYNGCDFGWNFERTVEAAGDEVAKEEARRKLISWVGSFYGHKGSLIDHMCISKPLVQVQRPETWIEKVEHPFSDHRPIMMRLPNAAEALESCDMGAMFKTSDYSQDSSPEPEDDNEVAGELVQSSDHGSDLGDEEDTIGDMGRDNDDQSTDGVLAGVGPGEDVPASEARAVVGGRARTADKPLMTLGGMGEDEYNNQFPPLG